MKLNKVVITKHDTCKTYALKRIGLGELLSMDSDEPLIENLVDDNRFVCIHKLRKGAILIWKRCNQGEINIGLEIDKNARVITRKKTIYGHCAVYEGKGLISDVYRDDVFSNIRFRKSKDIRKPDFILFPKKII